tara:strand:- start:768 stop:1055 length:288 start_codon:yes stop_codon:yes gene_type:complete
MEWSEIERNAGAIAESRKSEVNAALKPVKLTSHLDNAIIGRESWTGAYVYDEDRVARIIGATFDLSEFEAYERMDKLKVEYRYRTTPPIFMKVNA